MFHNFRECLGTFNSLIPVDRSEIVCSTLGEQPFGMIVDSVSKTISLHGVEGFIIWAPSWASD